MIFYNRWLLWIGVVVISLYMMLLTYNLVTFGSSDGWLPLTLNILLMLFMLYVLRLWARDLKVYRSSAEFRKLRNELLGMFAELTARKGQGLVVSEADQSLVLIHKQARFMGNLYAVSILRVDSDLSYGLEMIDGPIDMMHWCYCFFVGHEVEVLKSAEALMLGDDGEPIFMNPRDSQSFREYRKAFRKTPSDLKYADTGELRDMIRLLKASTPVDTDEGNKN